MAVISCIALLAVLSTQFMFSPLNYSNLEHIINLNGLNKKAGEAKLLFQLS